MHAFLAKLSADGGYQRARFCKGLATILPDLAIEIVRRSDHPKGLVALPRRWIVERTLARLNGCRRLAKDWENINRKALIFLRPASIRLMLRKLCKLRYSLGSRPRPHDRSGSGNSRWHRWRSAPRR
jgi:hypothetical protein